MYYRSTVLVNSTVPATCTIEVCISKQYSTVPATCTIEVCISKQYSTVPATCTIEVLY